MNPVTHFLAGWCVASLDPSLDRRERGAVTLAGVLPDLDGVGIVAELFTRGTGRELLWWSDYHHALLHNLLFAIIVSVVSLMLTGRRWRTGVLVFFSFHLHLLGDIAGSRGIDGDQWPVPYLIPFSNHWQLSWNGQWALNAWPNFVITAFFLALTFYLAWKRGCSPLEIFSQKADQVLVKALRQRFKAEGFGRQ